LPNAIKNRPNGEISPNLVTLTWLPSSALFMADSLQF